MREFSSLMRAALVALGVVALGAPLGAGAAQAQGEIPPVQPQAVQPTAAAAETASATAPDRAAPAQTPPAAGGDAEDDADKTVRTDRDGKQAQIPAFLRPADVDPVTLAEGNGSLAERLGLSGDDDQTDVGPVR